MENAVRLEENFDALSTEMGIVTHLRDEVARGRELRMGRWLQNVQRKEIEVDEIQKQLNELPIGCYPNNLRARIKLNKKVIESLKAVTDLKREGNRYVVARRVGSAAIPQGTLLHGDDSSESIEKFLSEIARERPLRFSRQQVWSFTSDLSREVGSGAYAKVYKGQFPNGVQVAVKVLKYSVKDDMKKQFKAEVSTMGRTYHRNLVRLYGYCFESNMKALVYEYMENGSLDKILYENHLSIEWEKLYGIAIETEKGISYLHENCHKRIIHYDIKAGNVLLDSDLSPKVTDFGLAKLCNRELSHVTLSGFRGTPGYAAPEVCMPLPVTFKCDVYSFGMMLFEILGRRKNWNRSIIKGRKWFPRQVWEKFEKGQLNEIMNDCGIGEKDSEKAKKLSLVALWCVQYIPQDRPPMSTVVKILEGEIQATVPPNPFPHVVSSGVDSMGTPGSVENIPSLISSSMGITKYDSKTTDGLGPVKLLYSQVSSKVSPASDERQVEAAPPSLRPTMEVENKTEDKKLDNITPEEKEKLITVVLKVYMHCEACATKILNCLKRMKGVQTAAADVNSSQVTVNGVFDPPKLVEYVYKKTNKRAEIVEAEIEKTEEEKTMLKTEQKRKDEEKGVAKTKPEKKEAMDIINSEKDENKEDEMDTVERNQGNKKEGKREEERDTAKEKPEKKAEDGTVRTKQEKKDEEKGMAKTKLDKRKGEKDTIETEPQWTDEKKNKEVKENVKIGPDKEEDNREDKVKEKKAEKENEGGDKKENESKPEEEKQQNRINVRAELKNPYHYYYPPPKYPTEFFSYPELFSDENTSAWCSIQ